MSSRRERIRSDRSQISEISSTRSPKVRPFEHDDEFANAQRVARSNEKKLSNYLKKANAPSDEEQSRAKELAKNMHKKHDMDGFKSMLGSAIEKVSNAEKKKGKPVSQDDRGQKITASGGSAINTAVFVQNANQLRKLLTPQYCSIPYMAYTADINSGNMTRVEPWIDGTKTVPNTCDAFSERRSPHQLAIILLFISIALQFFYGIGTLAETIYLRWIGAEIYESDPDVLKQKKMGKIVLTRTVFAVVGFIIAILTIVVGAFTDDL